jgi:hypothetical protein
MLNSYMGHADKLAEIGQCRKLEIVILPPSVNDGEFEFTPTTAGAIISAWAPREAAPLSRRSSPAAARPFVDGRLHQRNLARG